MSIGGLTHVVQFARNRPEPIRQASLMMMLAASVSDADLLTHTLRSLARESNSPWSDRLHQLMLLLDQGLSLGDAVARVDRLLPEESVIAIQIAEDSGCLEATLADEANRLLNLPGQSSVSRLLMAGLVMGAVMTVLIMILSFLMVFIIPKFKAIFAGFGMEFPTITAQVISVADSMGTLLPLSVLPICGSLVVLLVVGVRTQTDLLATGRSHFLEWLPRFRTPTVLRWLALSTAAEQTVGDSLKHALAEMHPSRAATALSSVRFQVDQGESLTKSLRTAGFVGNRELRFLDAAVRTNHLDWALRHLASDIERRRRLRLEQVTALLPILTILVGGAAVSFVVIGMYMPLIALVEHLTSGVTT